MKKTLLLLLLAYAHLTNAQVITVVPYPDTDDKPFIASIEYDPTPCIGELTTITITFTNNRTDMYRIEFDGATRINSERLGDGSRIWKYYFRIDKKVDNQKLRMITNQWAVDGTNHFTFNYDISPKVSYNISDIVITPTVRGRTTVSSPRAPKSGTQEFSIQTSTGSEFPPGTTFSWTISNIKAVEAYGPRGGTVTYRDVFGYDGPPLTNYSFTGATSNKSVSLQWDFTNIEYVASGTVEVTVSSPNGVCGGSETFSKSLQFLMGASSTSSSGGSSSSRRF